MLTCEKKAEELEDDSLLIIEGGGNSLKYLEEEETVTCMMESIKRIKEKKKLMKVAVLGIIPRPQEKAHYERQRQATNRRREQELCSSKQKLVRKKDGGVSFIDMDAIYTYSSDV